MNYEDIRTQQIVAEVLHQLGLDNGEMNVKQARKVYGKWFSDAFKNGRITPVRTDGKTKYFSRTQLLSLQAQDWKKAEIINF